MVLEALERAPDGLSVPSLMARVNVSKPRIEKTLNLLSLESPAPIAKEETRWQLTATDLNESFWERAERLTALRREEGQQMQEYLAQPFGRHMEFLVRALDGDPSGLTPPTLPPLPTTPTEDAVHRATAFLQRSNIPIQPRLQWPHGGMPHYAAQGGIPQHLRAEKGRALCTWGDAGWGTKVRTGKYRDRRFDDQLVTACKEMIHTWSPQPEPTWVTCIPSLRHPDLVPDFARRLAESLGLPFQAAIVKTVNRPEQKTMENSTFQARNVDGSLEVIATDIPTGPVLLVDDIVDSRWTLTVGAWLLRRHGVSMVWPLVLAQAGADE